MTKSPEDVIVRIVIIGVLLTLGYFGARFLGDLYYDKLLKLDDSIQNQRKNYQDQINRVEDPSKAVNLGMIFLKTDIFEDLALLSFEKANALDPLWRDAWVWKGYAELKTNDNKEALDALKKAQSIDPVYPLTYQLLAVAYTNIGDAESAKSAEEKMNYLSRTYQNQK